MFTQMQPVVSLFRKRSLIDSNIPTTCILVQYLIVQNSLFFFRTLNNSIYTFTCFKQVTNDLNFCLQAI